MSQPRGPGWLVCGNSQASGPMVEGSAVDPASPDPAYARLKAQLDTMPVIEQAKGIVMAQHGCGPAEAFDMLRRASQQANVKVAVLAALLVKHTSDTAAADAAEGEPGSLARPPVRQTQMAADGPAALLRRAHGPDVAGQPGAARLGGYQPRGAALARQAGGHTGTATSDTGRGELSVDERSPGPQDGRHGRAVVPPGTAVITMPGEVTYLNAEQVRIELAAALVPDTTAVVADFTHTGFCDSSGVRELVTAHKRATANNVAFRVALPPSRLWDFLARTGLAAYLPLYPSLAEAVTAAPRPAQ
jgi:anti-sigma B factor antagonist